MARSYDSTDANSHENGPDLARKARGVMSIGSLFAGIGGLELGLEWAGVGRTVWQVERDPFCRSILAHHWPDAARYDDVRNVGAHNLANVDVICGGFPCQDLSFAGKGAGLRGEKSGLFFELARIVRELRPRFVVLENVAAIVARGVGDVLGTLAALGYDSEWCCIRASDVGARHRRDRWFCVAWMADRERDRRQGNQSSGAAQEAATQSSLVADCNGRRRTRKREPEHRDEQCASGAEPHGRSPRRRGEGSKLSNTGRGDIQRRTDDRGMGDSQREGASEGLQRQRGRRPVGDAGATREPRAADPQAQPGMGGMLNGFPAWLHVARPGEPQAEWEPPQVVTDAPERAKRLRALGNAVVPQVAELVGRRLLEIKEREGL